MEFACTASADRVDAHVSGRVDSHWADHLDASLAGIVREGHVRIRLDLSKVTFLSSAGIAVLVKFYKQLHEIGGELVVANPSAPVGTVLHITRLTALLVEQVAPTPAPLSASEPRYLDHGGTRFEVYDLAPGAALALNRIGTGEEMNADGADTGVTLRCPDTVVAFGVGALGESGAECCDRFGEFVAVAGAAAYLPGDGTDVPDYLVASESFAPEVHTLHCLSAEGRFAGVARFDGAVGADAASLARLSAACLQAAGAAEAGMVIVAEAASLVGAFRRCPPSTNGDFFEFPAIREHLTFTAERAFPRSVALAVGIVARENRSYLRPMDAGRDLFGHFHAVAFPSLPLARGPIDLKETVARLFGSARPLGVLHLLSDDRPLAGIGQSEFVRGACWFAPLADIG